MWSGTESNRRHEDFQSSALPTELPDHLQTHYHKKTDGKKSTRNFAILVICIIMTVPGRAERMPQWQYYMKKADLEFAGSKYVFALENYRRALEKNPTLYEAANRIADIYLIQNNKREALDYCEQSLKINDLQAGAHGMAGELNDFFGLDERAFAHYLRAVEIDPMMASAHLGLVRHYIDNGNRKKADEHFEACARIGREEADREYGAAREAEGKGDMTEAKRLYLSALEKSPVHIASLFALAELARREGDQDAAVAHLERIKEIRPDNEKAHIYLGHLYFLMKGMKKKKYLLELSAKNYRRAIALNPRNAETYLALSEVYRYMGDEERALEAEKAAHSLELEQRKK
jgi:tetratricopeptide (TPR) repeat protein